MARQNLRGGLLQQPSMAARRRMMGWRFFAEVWGELRKAEWPTRQEAVRLTGIVIAIALTVAIVLGVIDFAFNLLGRFVLGS